MTHGFRTRIFALSFSLFFLTPAAQASVWVHGAFGAYFVHEDQGTSYQGVTLRGLTSATLGVALPQALLIGAQYLNYFSAPDGRKAWGVGAKAGLLVSGFELSGAYLPYTSDAQLASTRTGAGYTINVGYNFKPTAALRMGLYLTYWALHHSKENGSTLTSTNITRFVMPQLAIGLSL